MKTLRNCLFAMAGLALLALPATAQPQHTSSLTFSAGPDIWNTASGTQITLTEADFAALCGLTVGTTSQYIPLKGGELPGLNSGDTVVKRLDHAVFTSSGTATVRIRTTALALVSDGYVTTPCGPLAFKVGLDPSVTQREGTMTIVRQSNNGGVFHADVLIDGLIDAYDTAGGLVGSLPFSATLKNPNGGTPWSINPPVGSSVSQPDFYPGVNPVDRLPVPNRRWHEEMIARHDYILAIDDLGSASTTVANQF